MTPVTHALDHEDPRVQAAQTAEQAVYEHYGVDPAEHYVDIPDLQLQMRVVEVGTGPPLVLIPGGHGPGMIWIPFLSQLQGYTAYVMDRPGGLSDGIDYRSAPLRRQAASSTKGLFDRFDLDPAPVIGNSMGGLWALRFALLGCPALGPGTSAPLPMRLGSVPGLSGLIVDYTMQSGDAGAAREALTWMGHPSETAARLPDKFAEAWYRRHRAFISWASRG